MEDAHRLAQQQAADAGISAGPEPGGPARDDSAWDDLRSAARVAVPPEAVPCKPDAVQSGAQSCAAPELQGAEALLAVFVRELAARLADSR
jgi:hypothetical protein